ncbi:MAG: acetate--CoA ligase family protein, partial [Pikeienuella sp.]
MSLDRMFRPRGVAVVGASSNPAKIGGIPVAYLKSLGYAGRIIPVNPKSEEIQGLKAYPTLRDAPGPIDLAIVAVPAALVESTVKDAAAAGVQGLVVFSSGFAELGADGEAAQKRIAELARESGVRILGPNCLGYMNVAEELYASFSPVVKLGKPKRGKVAIVSQSGAFGAYALALANRRNIGVSHWITTGNEADLGFAECVEWLADDPETEVIVGYMEGCRDGARLRRALAAAERAGKPVILAKVGRSETGAKAAASHTAALAGEDAVFDGVFRQHGVLRGDSIEACFDMAYAAAVAGLPKGDGLGLFTVSGGAGVLMADEAAERGMEVPELSAETQRKVLELVPFAAARNPVDITGQVLNIEGAMRASLEMMAKDGACDAIVAFLAVAGASPAIGPAMAEDVKAARAAAPDRPIYVVTIATDANRELFEAAGCPVFDDPNRAVRALAALSSLGARWRSGLRAPAPAPAPDGEALPRSSTEPEALTRLSAAGLPTVDFRLAKTPEEAGEAAAAFGAPVAVKIVSPDILHKTEVGGVRLGLTGAEEVAEAARGILASAREKAPKARIDGLMVAPMTSGVAECVIGVQRDPVFGPVVMFGLGGVHVEAL